MRFDRTGEPVHSSPASITSVAEQHLRTLRQPVGKNACCRHTIEVGCRWARFVQNVRCPGEFLKENPGPPVTMWGWGGQAWPGVPHRTLTESLFSFG